MSIVRVVKSTKHQQDRFTVTAQKCICLVSAWGFIELYDVSSCLPVETKHETGFRLAKDFPFHKSADLLSDSAMSFMPCSCSERSPAHVLNGSCGWTWTLSSKTWNSSSPCPSTVGMILWSGGISTTSWKEMFITVYISTRQPFTESLVL